MAVSIGYDLYFAQGLYSPDTEQGLMLLAHELTHVVQFQKGNRLLYAEDLALLEESALAIESSLVNIQLHDVSSPILSSAETVSIDEEVKAVLQGEGGQDTDQVVFSKNMSMEGFRDRSRYTRYHVQLPSGKTVVMGKAAYLEMIERVSSGVRDWLEEERMINSPDIYEELMLRYYRWVQCNCW